MFKTTIDIIQAELIAIGIPLLGLAIDDAEKTTVKAWSKKQLQDFLIFFLFSKLLYLPNNLHQLEGFQDFFIKLFFRFLFSFFFFIIFSF